MPRKHNNMTKELNFPWITKDGFLDLTIFPIDSTLRQAISDNGEEFRSACQILGSMASAGRAEAGVFLYGLLKFCGADLVKKESVIKALRNVQTAQTVEMLVDELDTIESSNSTRGYINAVLNTLGGLPPDLVEDDFERLLSDPKWSYKMKRKFRYFFEEVTHRNWR